MGLDSMITLGHFQHLTSYDPMILYPLKNVEMTLGLLKWKITKFLNPILQDPQLDGERLIKVKERRPSAGGKDNLIGEAKLCMQVKQNRTFICCFPSAG